MTATSSSPQKTAPTRKNGRRKQKDEGIEKAPTGIAGFDEITRGGIPRRRTTLVLGGPGAGKTVFALQSLVNAARLHREPGIFVAFEENSRQIVTNAATFGWDLEQLERERLFFLDAHLPPAVVQAGDFDISAMLGSLAAKAKAMRAQRIVFDGLDVLLALLDDPVRERREIYRLREWLIATGLTGIVTAKATESETLSAGRFGFLQFMMDCVVSFHHTLANRVSLRSVRVMKYRGSAFSESEFPLIISSRGIEVSVFEATELDYDVSAERVSTGVPRLDHMLDGGYYRGSSVLITGAPGTAKTTLAAAFAEAACSRGERVLYVSFDEAGAQLARNAASVGIDLDAHMRADLLRVYARRTESRSAEEHLSALRQQIEEFQPRHLVLDPLSALAKTGGQVAAVHASLRLLDFARERGITTVETSLVSAEDQQEATNMQISTIADTWIHLAYLARGGERNRTLTIVKSRGMRHSNQVRELVLSERGVSLADVYTAGGEVLLGTARFEHETQQREMEIRKRHELRRRRLELTRSRDKLAAQIAALQAQAESREMELRALRMQERAYAGRTARAADEVRRLRFGDHDSAGDRHAHAQRGEASA